MNQQLENKLHMKNKMLILLLRHTILNYLANDKMISLFRVYFILYTIRVNTMYVFNNNNIIYLYHARVLDFWRTPNYVTTVI